MPPQPLAQILESRIPLSDTINSQGQEEEAGLYIRDQDVSHTASADLTLRLLLTKRTPADASQLVARQDGGVVILPQSVYAGINSGPAPGAVVGIVLGSVGGFLLLIWLLWTLSNGTTLIRTSGELEEVSEVRVRQRDSSRRTRSRRTTEVVRSRSGSPARRVYRSERIIRDYGDRSRSPSIARSRGASRVREAMIVDERVDGDDIIEVMEEHSSIEPRRKSRRSDRDRY